MIRRLPGPHPGPGPWHRPRRRAAGLAALALALAGSLGPQGTASAAPPPGPPPVLRVGVLSGSPPCSDHRGGRWSGTAVELWKRLATEEGLPFVFEARPTASALLEATAAGQLDVGVGCLNVTPERIGRHRFSLPFQEMGLAVLVKRDRLELGQAVLRSLLAPDLLRLLGGYLLAIGLVTALLWLVEGPERLRDGEDHRRGFAKVFQILATGPGTNTIAHTTRGHGLVIASYLIRIVTASLLVSYITINVVQQPRVAGGQSIRSLQDLGGLRVAARPGSVSSASLERLNAGGTAAPVTIVPLPRVDQAPKLLTAERADAVLADDQQLEYVLRRSGSRQLELALRNLQSESQAFVLAPQLDPATAARIDLAISRLKQQGVVAALRREAMNKS